MSDKVKKVRITSQGWIDGMERYFPNLRLGDEIDVEENPEYEHEYFITGSIYVIPKTDCEVVTEEEMTDAENARKIHEIVEHDMLGLNQIQLSNTNSIPSADMLKEITNNSEPARIVDGIIQFDKEKLERLNKVYTPTDTSHSEKIEITVDGNTYYINRKAWTLEKELRKYRNQLFEGTISQEVYDLLIETLLQ